MSDNRYKVIAVMGVVSFPDTPIICTIGKTSSKNAILNAYENKEDIVIVTQTTNSMGGDFLKCVNHIGTVCKIKNIQFDKVKNTIKIDAEGLKRVMLCSVDYNEKFLTVNTVDVQDDNENKNIISMLLTSAKEKFLEFISFNKNSNYSQDIVPIFNRIEDANAFINNVAVLVIQNEQKQLALLNEISTAKRLEILITFLMEEIEIEKINEKLMRKVKNSMDKNQKEYYLREQIKAISDELGEGTDELDEIEKKIKESKMPKEVKDKALKELARVRKLPQQAPDYSILRNYLDEVISLPWGVFTKDCKDLKKARQVLDENHSGLDKVKERIVENLAVMQLTGKIPGQIICFAGPPGVGKTSIAKSIADALNRKFVKMSVGGVNDESEIRGHRKTYVGAMPGRIIYNMKMAGSLNPVFLIDEIDKMSSDYKGDPTSAMLEVLDPEQNITFRDNFLEVPFDLSNVLFIATANNLQNIPTPLLDRMEVIELSSYTLNEKFDIAKNHLLPKQIKKHGLKPEQVKINDSTMKKIIEEYTYEAGVRSLERTIAQICRKCTVEVVDSKNDDLVIEINEDNLKSFLGGHKIIKEEKREFPEVGVVSGMSYSSVGGGILSIEVNTVVGEGKINLTGRLGDVMKESAQAALSAVIGISEELGLDTKLFKQKDIHIHVPEGAVKKDGPSAGSAIATAIYSAMSNKRIDNDLAMTGEITIRGNILAIGGLKEKLFACVRAGITKVLVPLQNKDDIEDLPKDIVDNLKIIYVNNLKEVLKNAIID